MIFLGILVAALACGWYAHVLYLRTLYKTMISIRRRLHGGKRRRRR